MKSMFHNPGAFSPFFDTPVAVEMRDDSGSVRRTTVLACVMDMGLDDPLSDQDAEPGLARWSVRVRASDFASGAPLVQDAVKFEDGRELGVERVAADHGEIELTCRGRK